MSDVICLSGSQMRRIEPYFPLSHGVPRVPDRRVISGIIFVIRNGLRWRCACWVNWKTDPLMEWPLAGDRGAAQDSVWPGFRRKAHADTPIPQR